MLRDSFLPSLLETASIQKWLARLSGETAAVCHACSSHVWERAVGPGTLFEKHNVAAWLVQAHNHRKGLIHSTDF